MQGEFEAAIAPLEEALKEEKTDDRLFRLAFTNLQLKKISRQSTIWKNFEKSIRIINRYIYI